MAISPEQAQRRSARRAELSDDLRHLEAIEGIHDALIDIKLELAGLSHLLAAQARSKSSFGAR